MKLENRLYYDVPTGRIIYQTGEASGDVLPHPEVTEMSYITVPYGSIDYTKGYISEVKDGKPVFVDFENSLSEVELENVKLKEDILLLQTENEVGGIL
ncbi:hypothetical protein ACIQZG_08335 [Lysinibacillus sp. NPDC096418]|uniref:hypothetical protein n=1 Tax=Lysinibacillus sp. NPDC096418 TaxID=3364138 RepID=UPI0038274FDB